MPRFSASLLLIPVALVASGCDRVPADPSSPAGSPSGETLVVERRTDGDAEHVVNVSGSRWEGARLVEELAIGDEVGADPYLFGEITSAWATRDALYVVDAQVPAVRAYDHGGDHLFDIGRPGQGPGEYGWPGGVAVTNDGRILVADAMNARINVYDDDGSLLEDWPLASQKAAQSLTLTHDDRAFTEVWSTGDEKMGVQRAGPEGPLAEPRFPPEIRFDRPAVNISTAKGGASMDVVLPYAPAYVWTLAPGGELVVGTGDAYRIEVHRRAGDVMVIERAWQPQPVAGGEARYRAALMTAALRPLAPEFALSAAAVPEHKPAFAAFHADRSDRLWVVREGAGRVDPDCRSIAPVGAPQMTVGATGGTTLPVSGKPGANHVEDPAIECWAATYRFDLFDLDSGELLASLDPPEPGFTAPLFAAEDLVLAAVADAAGTTRLKKYRLEGR